MEMTSQQPNAPAGQPTPERIFQSLTAYQQTAALKAAIELDLFTGIAEGEDTAARLARRSGAAERGVRILCDYVTVLQLLGKDGERYRLTPEAEMFLNRRSPAYMGGAVDFLSSPHLVGAFQTLTESVRKGGTTMEAGGSVTPEHPMWEDFARSMMALMRPSAEAIAHVVGAAEMGPAKVLDIAAGHGIFGITIARHNPEAEIYAVDWQNVLDVARENAKEAGVAARWHEISGDAFTVDFGGGYDLVLLTNFFHHFDAQTCEALMRKVHTALRDGGRAVTLEFVPDEGRVSPPAAAGFALVMLGTTPAGDAYTFSEYEHMFRRAGFTQSVGYPAPPSHIIVSHK
jgi:ubiquinone/menaquinone biosynthesis C-methylase UbiE